MLSEMSEETDEINYNEEIQNITKKLILFSPMFNVTVLVFST